MVVDVVSNEDDAVDDVASFAHFALNFSAGVDKTPENGGVDDVDTLGAPALVEVIEHHPDGFFAMQITRNKVSKLLDVV
jgi:hypothetical protein